MIKFHNFKWLAITALLFSSAFGLKAKGQCTASYNVNQDFSNGINGVVSATGSALGSSQITSSTYTAAPLNSSFSNGNYQTVTGKAVPALFPAWQAAGAITLPSTANGMLVINGNSVANTANHTTDDIVVTFSGLPTNTYAPYYLSLSAEAISLILAARSYNPTVLDFTTTVNGVLYDSGPITLTNHTAANANNWQSISLPIIVIPAGSSISSIVVTITVTQQGFAAASGNDFIITNLQLESVSASSTPGAITPAEIQLADPNSAACKALPITLQNFSVQPQGNTALLQWATATEINNQGFYIQRSTNGATWQDLSFLPSQAANGNSSVPLYYNFTDGAPQMGINYYRLKQVDFDGTVKYSDAQQATFGAVAAVYPNPVSSLLKVVLPVGANNVSYRLISVDGKVALSGKLNNWGDYGEIPVTGVASGLYFLQLSINGAVQKSSEVLVRH